MTDLEKLLDLLKRCDTNYYEVFEKPQLDRAVSTYPESVYTVVDIGGLFYFDVAGNLLNRNGLNRNGEPV